MVKEKTLAIIRNFSYNSTKFYNYFVLSFTSSLQFYLVLGILGFVLILLTLILGLGSSLIKLLLLLSCVLWLIHGIHGILHILEDYIYSKITKSVLSTLFTLILIKGVYLLFLI